MSDTQNPLKEPESSLEQLENRLYSRTPLPLRHDAELSSGERHIRIAPEWTAEAERKNSAFRGVIAKIMPWLTRILVASVLFFLFAGGVAFFGFWREGNTVSPQNLSLSVLGPVSAPAGEELFFEVTLGNYNELELESVDLVVEYPEGTRKPEKLSEPLGRYREELGALAPRATIARRLSLVPFGEEGTEKKIVVSVEYRSKGSNAIFSRKSEYSFVINAAPVSVVTNVPKEVSSGQSFAVSLDIVSNASKTIKALMVKAEFPDGFRPTQSTPGAAFGSDTWQFGDLSPEAHRTLKITGRIDAPVEEERVFRFLVGTENVKDEKALGVVFFTEQAKVLVTRSPVSIEAVINGEHGEKFVAGKAGTLRVDIPWENNLTVKLTDLEIMATLDGDIFDRNKVVGSGRYDATSGSIVWNRQSHQRFAVVDPGEGGTESFSFSLLPFATDPSRYRTASMKLHLFARARRLDEVGASEEVVTSRTFEIKVASTLALGTRLNFNTGSFTNTGPLPPKVGTETTYTIVWSLSNSSNSISGAKVVATLPSYTRWLGIVAPPSEKVSYNPEGGEVVWDAGDIIPGTGFGSPPREISFQVAILPSLSQVGTAPTVIGSAEAYATDRFTGTTIQSNVRPSLTTANLSESGGGIVEK